MPKTNKEGIRCIWTIRDVTGTFLDPTEQLELQYYSINFPSKQDQLIVATVPKNTNTYLPDIELANGAVGSKEGESTARKIGKRDSLTHLRNSQYDMGENIIRREK